MMLLDMMVKDFLTALKSDSPAPGGGSAAALVGGVAAALALMVGNLTADNEKYQTVRVEVQSLRPQLDERLTKLERFIDEDTAMFNQVMAAYRLPKTTETERSARSQAIQVALQQAAIAPMAVAECCEGVLSLAKRMLEIGNSNAASDAAVAGRMAHAAMWAAIYNVRINLASIKDPVFITDMKLRIDTVVEKTEASLSTLLVEADRKISL